MEEMVFPCW